MSFLSPFFLFACLFASIPILIHLFYFKTRKTAYFSDISLLKKAKVSERSRSQLIDILILLSRIAFICALVIAFAHPFLSSNKSHFKSTSNKVIIFLDNSLSMSRGYEDNTFFEQTKKNALTLIDKQPYDVKYKLVTPNLKTYSHYWMTKEEITDKVEQLRINSVSYSFDKVVKAIKNSIPKQANQEKIEMIIFSDYQKTQYNFLSLNSYKNDDKLNYVFYSDEKLKSNENIYIDSCWMEGLTLLPFQKQKLKVRIKNSTLENIENLPVKLKINQKLIGQLIANIPSKRTQELTFEFFPESASEVYYIQINIEDDFTSFDNNYFLTFSSLKKTKVSVISDKKNNDKIFKRLSLTDSNLIEYRYFDYKNIDYDFFNNSSLVVLDEIEIISPSILSLMTATANNIKQIFVIPNYQSDLESYNKLFKKLNVSTFKGKDAVDYEAEINVSHPFYKSVFKQNKEKIDNLFSVKAYFSSEDKSIKGKQVLIRLNNNLPLLVKYEQLNKNVFVLNTPLNTQYSGLANHEIIVPVFLNMVLLGGYYMKNTYTLEPSQTIDFNTKSGRTYLLSLEKKKLMTSFANNKKVNFIMAESDIESGFFSLNSKEDSIPLAFNYTRAESELEFVNYKEIKNMSDQLSINVKSVRDIRKSDSDTLWKIFLVLSLFFLIIEMVLIKIKYGKKSIT